MPCLVAEDSEKEPACILFVLMFLAEHHSYKQESEKALALLQRALNHTPTLIELYIIKGSILKVSATNECQAIYSILLKSSSDNFIVTLRTIIPFY